MDVLVLNCPECGQAINDELVQKGHSLRCPACRRRSPAWRWTPAAAPPAPAASPGVLAGGYGDLPGLGLEAPQAADLPQWQLALNHRRMGQKLRRRGNGSAVWGIIALVIGAVSLGDSPLNAVLILIGLGLLGEGIWLTAAPSLPGFIWDGVALMVLGIWNIGVSVLNGIAGAGGGFFSLIGIVQLGLGVASFSEHKKYAALPMAQPTPDFNAYMQRMVANLLKAKPGEHAQLVEFKARGDAGELVWKGALFNETAIFIDAGKSELLIVRRDACRIEAKPKPPRATAHPARFVLGDKEMRGRIKPEYYARFSQWLPQAQPGAAG